MTLKSKFKAKLVHLAPISGSLLLGLLCTQLIVTSSIEIYALTPFPEGIGSLGNASYFIVLVGVGASLLYLLLKRRSHKLVMLITGFSLTATTFMLSFVYSLAALSRFGIPHFEVYVTVSSVLLAIFAVFAIFRIKKVVRESVVLCLGGALGAFLGVSIPTLSTVLILCSLSIYDAFAVYRGPVGKIAINGLDQLQGLSFSFKNLQMGLGDLTFYSMLSCHVLLNFGVFPCLASATGILSGCLLTFRMLERRRMFPGLPFPVSLGLVAGLLTCVFL